MEITDSKNPFVEDDIYNATPINSDTNSDNDLYTSQTNKKEEDIAYLKDDVKDRNVSIINYYLINLYTNYLLG